MCGQAPHALTVESLDAAICDNGAGWDSRIAVDGPGDRIPAADDPLAREIVDEELRDGLWKPGRDERGMQGRGPDRLGEAYKFPERRAGDCVPIAAGFGLSCLAPYRLFRP